MISVVIPTYNEAAFIGTALESLALQEIREPLEIVVADKGSRDRTREIAEGFRGEFSSLLIMDGGTPAIGRNRGALASTGDPIFFIDADLELRDPRFLERNAGYFRSHRLAAATVKFVPKSNKWIDHAMVRLYNTMLWPASFIRPLGSMCIAADRSTFEKTRGFPEDVVMAEDHDFVLQCSKVGRYGIMPMCAHFNVRRFEKEGRLPLLAKYLRATALRVFRGPITVFDYEFGCFDEDRSVE